MPFRSLPMYDSRPGAFSTVTFPPEAGINPAYAAAAQIDESPVYTSVPHTPPVVSDALQLQVSGFPSETEPYVTPTESDRSSFARKSG
jgi:hypothetical protein